LIRLAGRDGLLVGGSVWDVLGVRVAEVRVAAASASIVRSLLMMTKL
jgi:hypothetical protein